MLLQYFSLCFLINSVICCLEQRCNEKSSIDGVANPIVATPSGLIKGSLMETRKGRRIYAYRGVRYAEAPVGKMRFQPPVLIQQYKEVVDASEEGPACPMPVEVEYFLSEDCLRLNVYSPVNSCNASLPVVVYIHAGGFYSLSGRSDVAGPQYLLDRDMVLVTINYRLGSLGFLSTGDALAPGNNGFKDQVAALRWIQKNIRSFGGDPNSVTITGCSAGSTSVMLHMVSPMSKGLFHRAVSMSGSPTTEEPLLHHNRDLAVKQAKLVNCPYDSSKAIMDCLKTKTWKEIADTLLGFFEFGYDPVGIWPPVVELDFGQPRFLPIQPVDAIKQRKLNAVPFIVSQTEEEFAWKAFTVLRNATLLNQMNANWDEIAPISFMLPRDERSGAASRRLKQTYLHNKTLKNDQESAAGLGHLYGDAIIGFPVHRMANLMARHSSKRVWYYRFCYVGEHSHYEDPVTKKPIGAMHMDDLVYLFSLSYRFPMITTDSPDSAFVDKMTAIWYNFARYGDPNPKGDTPELTSLCWPVMTVRDRKYLRLDKELSVQRNLLEDRFQVWEELYPIEY